MILSVENLKQYYPLKKIWGPTQTIKALDGVSFTVEEKSILGIVGESGCGKSTLARGLVGLERPTEGSILLEGRPLVSFSRRELQSKIQIIFQDPYGSLNPRKKVWQLIAEPLFINTDLSKRECFFKALDLMEKVGLRHDLAYRYPHMLSGGQRQRIGIARALGLKPKVLVCDEPVSALDVSIQAQVLNLLLKLQNDMGLTYLFIGHDLSVIEHISDHILVMYLGKVVEYGPREKVFGDPCHPYTKALMLTSPKLDRRSKYRPIEGELPSPLNPPSGCAFHKRCPLATDRCRRETPSLEKAHGRLVSCFEV